MKRITVLLAEDHTVVSEGLRQLLAGETDLVVVGAARTGRQAVTMAKELRPEVVVMDVSMPLLNGLEATRQLRKVIPGVKILILSAHSDEAYAEHAAAIGAAGFLHKHASAHDLCQAIREAHKGNTVFNPSTRKRSHEASAQKSTSREAWLKKKISLLSSREVEVLQLIAEGKANKQTALELGISIKTVEKHRQGLMEKLNLHDTAGITRYAVASGIIESCVQTTIV